MSSIDLADIPNDLRKQLGLKKQRTSQFSKDDVRRHALRALNTLADLTQQQRRRVLDHAQRINNV